MAAGVEFVFQFKRDRANDWTIKNPTLRAGEPGVEVDTGRFKLGDGYTKWNELAYFVPVGGEDDTESLEAHILSDTPHPAYDDGPSFVLLYNNRKV